MEVHKQYCNNPLSGLSKSSSESIIMIPEKVHKTYYKIMFKQYTTIIQKKDLKNKPASTGMVLLLCMLARIFEPIQVVTIGLREAGKKI